MVVLVTALLPAVTVVLTTEAPVVLPDMIVGSATSSTTTGSKLEREARETKIECNE